MKILELHLTAFGPFDGVTINLSQGNQGLHIIYGPNEAGKSSALRALRQVFYGIPVRSADNFRHPHNKMRIGASIRHNNGDILEFIRRKGKNNTLRGDDDETILEDTILNRFLKGIDADLFSTMFGIDHSDLVKGGKEIIKGGGNLGQIIFAAGSGITSLRNVQAELQNNADALFKPTGKIPRINESILRVKENRKKLRDAQLASGDWVKHDQALQGAVENKKHIERKLTDARTGKNRLERIGQALPIIAQRRELLEDPMRFASAVLLPDNFGKQRREYISELQIARNDQEQARTNIRQVQNDIDQLGFSNQLLQNADTIESVYQELGGFVKAIRDRIHLQTRMDILRSEAKQTLRDLRDDLTIDDADRLRLSKKDTLHIQELGSRYERIVTLLESTREEIPRLEHDINVLDDKLAALNTPRQTDRLSLAIDRAAEYASIEKQCLEDLSEFQNAVQSLEIALGKQTLWSGSLEDLEKLLIPSTEAIEVFENDFEATKRIIQTIKTDIKNIQDRLSDTLKKKEELSRNLSVPTEGNLRSARELRDSGWHLVAASLNEEPAPGQEINDFIAQVTGSTDLTDLFTAFENSVGHADEIADRLRREADRVATLAKLISDETDLEKKLAHSKTEHKTAEKNQEVIALNWIKQWTPAEISPASPKEMRLWATRLNDMAVRFAELRNQKNRTESLKKTIDTLRHKLEHVFESISEPAPEPDETLIDLIKRGRQIIDKEKELAVIQDRLLNDKSQNETALSESRIRVQVNEKELSVWQNSWEQAVAPLGLDVNSVPAHANALMEDLKSLFDKLKEANILQKRIDGIDRDASVFSSMVSNLVNDMARDLTGHPAEKAAKEINHRLKETRTAYSKIQTLEKQINKEKLRIRQSAKTIMEIEAFLKTMCEEAGCKDYKDLSEAENRSAKRRELESDLKALEAQLLKLSAGASIEDFVKESLTVESDSIQSNIKSLSENIDLLIKEKSHLDQTIGSERTELSKMDGSARAAALAEETQTILGGLEENIENYARFRIAATILNQAIERFRDKNQSPVLQKASSFFSRLTGGSFEGIRAEFDDSGNPVIAGIRKNGKEIVNVDCMSEGTADQLFLSLRLAGLEEYLDKNDPIPFIVDDILIKFDDIRAKATLMALAGLSEKTQIIFFTHHRHLVNLAEKHIDPSILVTHTLTEKS
ncbi:MAG: AAA family ATPase [Desulfobacteraceae bacterium]|nr:AAA family ATPase [Desulfobacteraceae bacterium]MBC2757142.1 AAA family ATPase [Desulfobacteraceae bacterium]